MAAGRDEKGKLTGKGWFFVKKRGKMEIGQMYDAASGLRARGGVRYAKM